MWRIAKCDPRESTTLKREERRYIFNRQKLIEGPAHSSSGYQLTEMGPKVTTRTRGRPPKNLSGNRIKFALYSSPDAHVPTSQHRETVVRGRDRGYTRGQPSKMTLQSRAREPLFNFDPRTLCPIDVDIDEIDQYLESSPVWHTALN